MAKPWRPKLSTPIAAFEDQYATSKPTPRKKNYSWQISSNPCHFPRAPFAHPGSGDKILCEISAPNLVGATPLAVKRHATVKTARQLKTAAEMLARQCKVMARILKRTGLPAQRDFPADFSGLAKIVVGQQLSAQSAAAIWGRLAQSIAPFTAEAISAASDDALKQLGLSNGKIRTLRAISSAVLDDGLDLAILATSEDALIVERLTAIHGVGPWTADIFLLFALARRDAFAPGDLALQLAVQHHFKLERRPTADELAKIAERWRPARAVAAQLLWADYAVARRALLGKSKKALISKST
jgi:DNA-3-methyladenine glycosylase II